MQNAKELRGMSKQPPDLCGEVCHFSGLVLQGRILQGLFIVPCFNSNIQGKCHYSNLRVCFSHWQPCSGDGVMKEVHLNIFKDDVKESAVVSQQGSDPKHTFKLAQNLMEEIQMKVLEWPSPSSNLIPVGNLWQEFKVHPL